MRKVIFKKWTSTKGTDPSETIKVKEYDKRGFFHQWSVDYEEFEGGVGHYAVAIVELDNGEIEQVLPSLLKFIEKPIDGDPETPMVCSYFTAKAGSSSATVCNTCGKEKMEHLN